MCKHTSKIGDNNGMSCAHCGQQLEGYGHRGHGATCIHYWDYNIYSPTALCTWCGEKKSLSETVNHQPPAPYTVCRQCGCSNEDACRHPDVQLFNLFGVNENCCWVEEDLCSHCFYRPGEATRYSILNELETAAEGAFCD